MSNIRKRGGRGRQFGALKTRRYPPIRRWISEIWADARKCYSGVSAASAEAKAQTFNDHFRNLSERLSFYQWQLFRELTPSVAKDGLPEDLRQLLRSGLKAIWERRVSPTYHKWISKAADDAKPQGWRAPEWLRQTLRDRSEENVDHSQSNCDGLMSVAQTKEVLSRLTFDLDYRLLIESDRMIREFILSTKSAESENVDSAKEKSGLPAEASNLQYASLRAKKQQRKWPTALQRERMICEIIKSGLKGLDYCKEMDAQGVRLPKARTEAANSLRTYVQTYYEKRWRDRIWQEKKRLTRKYGLKDAPVHS